MTASPYLAPFKASYPDGFAIRAVLLRPESRGYVRLRSPDPADVPLIVQNFLATETDWRVMRAGVRIAQEVGRQPAMRPFVLRQVAPDPLRVAAFQGLAAAEDTQAEHWAGKLKAAGAPVPPFCPALRDRLLLALAPRLGPRAILPIVAADALRGVEEYRAQADAAPIVDSEVAVARAAVALMGGGPAAEATERGREHRRSTAGNGRSRARVGA